MEPRGKLAPEHAMERTKNMEKKYVRKATRTGQRSLSVVIPAEIVSEMKIREKQKLTIKKIRGGFEVKDWKNR